MKDTNLCPCQRFSTNSNALFGRSLSVPGIAATKMCFFCWFTCCNSSWVSRATSSPLMSRQPRLRRKLRRPSSRPCVWNSRANRRNVMPLLKGSRSGRPRVQQTASGTLAVWEGEVWRGLQGFPVSFPPNPCESGYVVTQSLKSWWHCCWGSQIRAIGKELLLDSDWQGLGVRGHWPKWWHLAGGLEHVTWRYVPSLASTWSWSTSQNSRGFVLVMKVLVLQLTICGIHLEPFKLWLAPVICVVWMGCIGNRSKLW